MMGRTDLRAVPRVLRYGRGGLIALLIANFWRAVERFCICAVRSERLTLA